MKIIIIIVITLMGVASLITFTPQVSAFITPHLNTPLQVQMTPSQEWNNQETRNNLIATYGLLLFNSCSGSEQYCTSSMDSYGYATCLRFVQLDLAQSIKDGCRASCSSGYYRASNGQCLTPEAGCNKEFGQDSHFLKYNTKGEPDCGTCAKGDVWDPYYSRCVAQTPSGRLNTDNKLTNDCASGYEWNSSRDRCVVISPKRSQDQICKDRYGENSIWDRTIYTKSKNWARVTCDCVSDYKWNKEKTMCVALPVTPASKTTSSQTADLKTTESPNLKTPDTKLQDVTFPKLQDVTFPSQVNNFSTDVTAKSQISNLTVSEVSNTPVSAKNGFWSWFLGLFGY